MTLLHCGCMLPPAISQTTAEKDSSRSTLAKISPSKMDKSSYQKYQLSLLTKPHFWFMYNPIDS